MKKKIKNFKKRIIHYIIPKKISIIKNYRKYHGKYPNLKNPIEFGEKIQWLKLYGRLENYSKYVCKYEVRDYVKSKVGEQYLIPLIAVYEDITNIKLKDLPDSFVLKGTHGAGYNIIVKDKSNLNEKELLIKLDEYLSDNYYYITLEPQYKNIKPRIVCEKYITDDSGTLRDYKIYCSNGKARCIEVHNDRSNNHQVNYYNTKWEKMNIKVNLVSNIDEEIHRPKNLELMIKIAEKLAEDFQFVRVDLYHTENQVYFGELTFTSANGLIRFEPEVENLNFGDMIRINK